jgi:ubiquitin-protein ligase
MLDRGIRRTRLRHDLEAMTRLRCDAIDFEAEGSDAPERYEIRFKLRSLLGASGDTPIYTPDDHVHRVEIRLPAAYPEGLSKDDVSFLSAPIFHPNVFTDGRICINDYQPNETLDRFVLRIAKYIQADPAFTGLASPANGTARTFFQKHPQLFPTDRTALPDGSFMPAGRTFVVGRASQPAAHAKRRFVPSTAAPRRRFVVSADRHATRGAK